MNSFYKIVGNFFRKNKDCSCSFAKKCGIPQSDICPFERTSWREEQIPVFAYTRSTSRASSKRSLQERRQSERSESESCVAKDMVSSNPLFLNIRKLRGRLNFCSLFFVLSIVPVRMPIILILFSVFYTLLPRQAFQIFVRSEEPPGDLVWDRSWFFHFQQQYRALRISSWEWSSTHNWRTRTTLRQFKGVWHLPIPSFSWRQTQFLFHPSRHSIHPG